MIQSAAVFGFQLVQLRAQGRRPVGLGAQKEVAHMGGAQQHVTAQAGERLILYDIVAVDIQVLLGYRTLDAVSFHRGEDQQQNNGCETPPSTVRRPWRDGSGTYKPVALPALRYWYVRI